LGSGKMSDNRATIGKIKRGDYIRWKPLPLELIYGHDYRGLPGDESKWEYALVLEVLESPRNEAMQPGLHLRILKNGQSDWIFNFELFRYIEIIGEHKKGRQDSRD